MIKRCFRTLAVAALLAAFVAARTASAASPEVSGPNQSLAAPDALAAAQSESALVSVGAVEAGYVNADLNGRLQQLQTNIAQQQEQIRAQQAQVDALKAQVQPASPKMRLASQIIPGADTEPPDNIYPGSAAPLPVAPTPPTPYVIGSDRGLTGAWTNDGPVFSTRNGDFTFHPRWVSQLDMIALHSPVAGVTVPGGNSAGTQDSVDFRRLRFGADGTMWGVIDYVFEADFAFALQNTDPTGTTGGNGAIQPTGLRNTGTLNGGQQSGNAINVFQPTTIFLTYKDMPLLGNIRIGNQQDWISLEHIESARFQDFMERSPLMDAFYGPNNNGYAPGISTYRTYMNDNLAIQLGAYKANYYDSGYAFDIGNSNYSYGGRIHCTPYYDVPTKGRYLFHMGVAGEYRTFNQNLNPAFNGDNVRIRARGDLRNVASTLDPNFADTGNFFASGQALVDPEFILQWGPWMVQGEYTMCWMTNALTAAPGTAGVPSVALGNVMFHGGYVETLYFLTGDNRSYQRPSGVFGRTIPLQNAFLTRGAGFGHGAIQVGVRYDWLDLNSGPVQGGQLQNYTLGLNWFLNPNARFQLNYVLSHVNTAASGGPLSSTTTGVLLGSRVNGIGNQSLAGARMDFSF